MRRTRLLVWGAALIVAVTVLATPLLAAPGGNGKGADVTHFSLPEEKQSGHSVITPSGNQFNSARDTDDGQLALSHATHNDHSLAHAMDRDIGEEGDMCVAHAQETPSGKTQAHVTPKDHPDTCVAKAPQ